MKLLSNKNAIVYGAAGAIGSTIARTFAREGARVFLAGRTLARVEAVADDIRRAGGVAVAAVIDALDPSAVEAHADSVVERAGTIDVAVNAVGILHVQGTPFAELGVGDFAHPIDAYTRAHFITAKAVARHMVRRGSGVIMSLSTPGSRLPGPGFMGFGVACAAIEAMTRHLAGELGPRGIRAVCLRPDAMPESIAHGSHARQVFRAYAEQHGKTIEAILDEQARPKTLLGRLPTLQEVADAAAFFASDRSSAMTGVIANLTCGSLVDGY